MKTKTSATLFAFLAAALYGCQYPISKQLLTKVEPTMMAAFLYLGAGIGLCIISLFSKKKDEDKLTKHELPYVIGMIVLDIIAPILLMIGLTTTNSASASLLNNFEIVVTSCIAFIFFQEVFSKRLIIAIILVTLASFILSIDQEVSFQFDTGAFYVLGACCCWGLENNCTRMLSSKNATTITIIKGIFSGLGSLIIALLIQEHIPSFSLIIIISIVGFFAYGLSINFYIKAQKDLGAAKTSAYYSIAPFLGVFFSMLLLQEHTEFKFYIGLIIMIIATILLMKDTITLQHSHKHTHVHTHSHRHGDLIHTHEHSHTHTHTHTHGTDETKHDHTHNQFCDHDEIHHE